jgi:hypothetical protein
VNGGGSLVCVGVGMTLGSHITPSARSCIAGKRLCGAFYGHPGVFTWPIHTPIDLARSDGYPDYMEPEISAAGCLYAARLNLYGRRS